MTIETSVLKLDVTDKAAKKSAKQTGAPKEAAPAEVEITDRSSAPDVGWRLKKDAKPFSLSVAVTPRVLDVFTCPKGNTSDRRRVFFLGESLQWNVIHRVDPFIRNVPYNVTIHLQRIGVGSFADNAARIESVFPIESKLSSNLKYQFQATHQAWFWDQVPPFSGTISGTAEQIVQAIARGDFLLPHPGVWRMSAIVTVLSDVGRAYHLRSFAWDYEIVGRRRKDG